MQCKKCSTGFEITDVDRKFYESMKVPEPTFCPDCRQQRRLVWRNETNLYHRKCDATGKDIISVFSPDKPFIVYENDYWYSDKWNGLDYGQDFDFNRPFFDQFKELMHKVPQLGRSAVANQNSDFVNQCGWCKNCYLIFEADHDENCYYSNCLYDSRSSMDMLQATNCELCYECIDCHDSYGLKFSQNCSNCHDSWFLKNCIGCKNCFGSVNLRNKEFYYFNEKLSEEEYLKKVNDFALNHYNVLQKMKQQFFEHSKKYPNKYLQGVQNEDSSGEYMNNTQRCNDCYDINDAQDCRFVFNSRHVKNVYDMTIFGSLNGAEFSYENHELGDGARNVLFSDQIWTGVYDITYSKLCVLNSHHLFGCASLKHSSYCILNKQYSEDEFNELVPKIIEHMKSTGEWGEFFPAELSPFGYNETIAQRYYLLTKDEAIKQGFNWSDYEVPPPKAEKIIPAERLPDDINDVPDDILNWAIQCEETGKPFKIIPQELKFYRDNKLPIPHIRFEERNENRHSMRNPRKLFNRKCDKCKIDIRTSYSSNSPWIVYCDKCYKEAVS